MAQPNIDINRIPHGATPSVLAELTRAIIDFRRSPYFMYQCAILAAFLCLGAGSAFLAWGIAQSSKMLVWTGLSWFMLSFACWAVFGISVLVMLCKLITEVARAKRRENL